MKTDRYNEAHHQMTCKNCENDLSGKFCKNCGQKSNTKRINFNYLIEELSNSVLQINKGLLFTIKELFTRPGHSIREFLEGKRIRHIKPLTFIVYVSTFYVIIAFLTNKNTYLGKTILVMIESMSVSLQNLNVESYFLINMLKWFGNNHVYSTLMMLPIISFASYAAFIRQKYNYLEHLVINFYISGQQIVIYLIFGIILFKLDGKGIYYQLIPQLFVYVFQFWAFTQLFKNNHIAKNILLTFLTYFLYFVLTVICFIFLVAVDILLNRQIAS